MRHSRALLRKDLAVREQADLRVGRVLTKHKFRARVAHILQTYSVPKAGQQWSYLQKLISGMPQRLARSKAIGRGRCAIGRFDICGRGIVCG